MRPSHRLDLLIVPADPIAQPIGPATALIARLQQDGVIVDGDRPGPEAERWVSGGFARLHLDIPDTPQLYANRQGGFRVTCPETGDPIADAFRHSVQRWRTGGARALQCPSCGTRHALEAVQAAPPLAFGALALVTADAASANPTPWAHAQADLALGPSRLVRRRG